jgi:phosphatidylserine decarboxylase
LKVIELHADTILDIKNDALTLHRLLGTPTVPKQFANGICLQFRLAPCDYHRFGYIDNGVQGPINSIDGRLYSVSPLALRHMPAIWGRNHRHWCAIETKNLGAVLQIEVGATVVGSIVQHQPAGGNCTRGGEKGYFQMGGSTVLIVLEPGRVEMDEEILRYSGQGIETLVKYGEAVGRILP